MANTCACDIEFLKCELEDEPKDWKTILPLQDAPEPKPSVAPPPQEPLPGEIVHFWQVRASSDSKDDTWNTIPEYMWHAVDRELNLNDFLKASAPTTRKRRRGKDTRCTTRYIYISKPRLPW